MGVLRTVCGLLTPERLALKPVTATVVTVVVQPEEEGAVDQDDLAASPCDLLQTAVQAHWLGPASRCTVIAATERSDLPERRGCCRWLPSLCPARTHACSQPSLAPCSPLETLYRRIGGHLSQEAIVPSHDNFVPFGTTGKKPKRSQITAAEAALVGEGSPGLYSDCLVTEPAAVGTELGVIKSGTEADLFLTLVRPGR